MKEIIFSFREKFIKAALVEKEGSSFDILEGFYEELPAGLIEEGAIVNFEQVKSKLSDIIKQNPSLKSHPITVLLSEEAGFLKVLKIATDQEQLLKNRELQEEVPYPLAGSFTSLRLLPNKNIQLAATPRDLISAYQKLFKEVGLEIHSIVLEPTIFLPFLEKAIKPTLILSMEGETLLLVVIFEGGIYFTTTKKFKEAAVEKAKLTSWVKEIVTSEIKNLSEKLDFETWVVGENEDEIVNILTEGSIAAKPFGISLGKVAIASQDLVRFKKLAAAAGLPKQIPAFHIKDTLVKAAESVELPKLNLKMIFGAIATVLILILLVWFGSKVLNNSAAKNESTKVPSTVSTARQSTTSASVSASTSAKVEKPKQSTPAAAKKPAVKVALKRSDFKIEVLNGNGVPGAASEAKDFLEAKGYRVVSTGNAANYNFIKTEIRLKKSKTEYLSLLTKDLSSRYTVVNGGSIGNSSAVDAQVIIGKK